MGVGVLTLRLLHVVPHWVPMHRPCHHLETCKYSPGRVTPYTHLHFAPCDSNTFFFFYKQFYILFPCRNMIDPACKPVQAQQAKPVVKPASTHSLPKRAQLVLPTYPEAYSIHIFLFQQFCRNSTVLFRQLILSLST